MQADHYYIKLYVWLRETSLPLKLVLGPCPRPKADVFGERRTPYCQNPMFLNTGGLASPWWLAVAAANELRGGEEGTATAVTELAREPPNRDIVRRRQPVPASPLSPPAPGSA